ncbi:MAG: energy-coupling factor transporter transmembrane protein EcfT [Sporolactobacillus sp.]|jgi:energy-coupling factor transport system permease protein|nr:energy-coupling factor transporter transmembrane protein EcfT [Sporolactobacillus sp.]
MNTNDLSNFAGKTRGYLHVDFRAKLAICALAFITTALMVHDGPVCLMLLFLMIYLAAQGLIRAGIIGLIVGAALAGLRSLSGEGGLTVFLPDILTFAVLRILAAVMAVHAIIRMPPGEVTAALSKMHVPSSVALPLIFMLRFAPTATSEFRTVFAAMKLRKLLSAKHPLRTFEYAVIPLIVRTSNVADALAAAAELRGIAYPGLRTSLRQIHFTITDSLAVAGAAVAAIACFFIDRGVVRL